MISLAIGLVPHAKQKHFTTKDMTQITAKHAIFGLKITAAIKIASIVPVVRNFQSTSKHVQSCHLNLAIQTINC